MRPGNAVCTAVIATTMAACGTQPAEPAAPGGTSTTATIPSHAPGVIEGPAGTIDVVVQEPPDRAASAVRYLRVEDATGKPVLEREYRTVPAEFAETVAAGDYRIISWLRDCGGGCEGKTDQQLGQPVAICGIRVNVKEDTVATVTVEAPADADCTMTTG